MTVMAVSLSPTPEKSAVEAGPAKIVTHDFDCFATVCKRVVRVLWYLPALTATAQTLPLVVSRTPWANRDRATRAFVCVLSHLTDWMPCASPCLP